MVRVNLYIDQFYRLYYINTKRLRDNSQSKFFLLVSHLWAATTSSYMRPPNRPKLSLIKNIFASQVADHQEVIQT